MSGGSLTLHASNTILKKYRAMFTFPEIFEIRARLASVPGREAKTEGSAWFAEKLPTPQRLLTMRMINDPPTWPTFYGRQNDADWLGLIRLRKMKEMDRLMDLAFQLYVHSKKQYT